MIRNKTKLKLISQVLLITFLGQMIFPTAAMALTGGPSQPEVQSFEPIGTNQMVDPFTGDFTYNIPLMDVGGYPINISYHSGITMDQEASWVGLGWNINPGVINRNLRGLPDDFDGETVSSEFNMKPNKTYSFGTNLGSEFFGLKNSRFQLSLGLGINYNNYNGVGVDFSLRPSYILKESADTRHTVGLGISSSSSRGLDVRPNYSYDVINKESQNRDSKFGINVGVTMNSRAGLIGMNVTPTTKVFGIDIGQILTRGKGSSISFVPNTYFPQHNYSFNNSNLAFNLILGISTQGYTGSFDVNGGYSKQELESQYKESKAYGYIHSEKSQGNNRAMLDFNREKEGSINRFKRNLPVTNFTYDLFAINGQGIGGMFRAHRSDVGHVYDAYVKNNSKDLNAGIELGFSSVFKWGIDAKVTRTKSASGKIKSPVSIGTKLDFQKTVFGNSFEPSYFKMIGEMSADVDDQKNEQWKSDIHSNSALRLKMKGDGYNVEYDDKYILKNGNTENLNVIKRDSRSKRGQTISSLSKQEVNNGVGIGDYSSSHGSLNHIGELSILKTDGSRYVYGIPAYNFVKSDVTFNISSNNIDQLRDCQTGLVPYGNEDASVSNKKGIDNYFQKTKTPAYAHSYLISSVISPDYVDFDGIKGPSIGDFGNWIKFEYEKIDNYKWRVPFKDHKASYNEGLKSLGSDDKASYIYGEKELFYLEKINSRSYVAVFHKSDRKDGRGVLNEHGGGVGESMKRLDKISLYSKSEFESNIADLSAATPIKEVHFEYDYSLCPNVPNNDGSVEMREGENANANQGKLTLKKIYFTYGKSYKAKFSAYEFDYADLNHNGQINAEANPEYNLKGYDRWGHYKPNSGGCEVSTGLTAPEFPYVDQDPITADVYQAAWSLTDISMPSGGLISIDYESDDYLHVQDKKAMQMFKILGVGDGTSAADFSSKSNSLYEGKDPNHVLFFELQEPMPSDSPNSKLKETYFGDNIKDLLYFRFLINLGDGSNAKDYEYVSGYAELDDNNPIGFVDAELNGHYHYGYINLKKISKGDRVSNSNNAQPMAKAAWNFARKYNPTLAYNSGDFHHNASNDDIEMLANRLIDVFDNYAEFFRGPNGHLRQQGFGKKFSTNKSWIRLNCPSDQKYGGGVRVKKLVMKDSWSEMTTNGTTSEYGQVYSYEQENGKSSGVAAYEPQAGGDENPFRQPIYWKEKPEGLLVPDHEHYLEKPMGESFFPSPSVGYSRVVIKNLQYENVTQHSTGKTVKQFYTARDFPTKVDYTSIKTKYKLPNAARSFFKSSIRTHLSASQGYVVETNDMHGKPKSESIFSKNGLNRLSQVEYHYKTETSAISSPTPLVNAAPQEKRLANTVPILFKDNTIQSKEIGVTYDMINDFQESVSNTESLGQQINSDMILAGIIPVLVPILYPAYSTDESKYQGAVTTKLVNRFAILDKVVAYDQNSKIETKNLLWDSETGQVLLMQVQNEFDDPVYNFNYPAHLIYTEMEGAYQNIGFQENITVGTSSSSKSGYIGYNLNNPSSFHKGDELMMVNKDNEMVTKAWVWCPYPGEDDENLYVIDKTGHEIPDGNYFVKVIRSGFKNLAGAPIGQITSKENPISLDKIAIDQTTGILAASATEFKEDWQVKTAIIDSESDLPYVMTQIPHGPLDPDISIPVFNGLHNLFETLAAAGKIDGVQRTMTLSSIKSLSNATFSTGNETILEQTLVNPIPGTVYLTLSYKRFDHQLAYPSLVNQIHVVPSDEIVINFHNSDNSIQNGGYIRIKGFLPTETALNQSPMVSMDLTVSGFESGSFYHRPKIWFGAMGSNAGFADLSSRFINNSQFPFIIGTNIQNLATCPITPAATQVGLVANPYVMGVKGNWRPKESFTYLTDREYSSGNVNLKTDGSFVDFVPFWLHSGNSPKFQKNTYDPGTVTSYPLNDPLAANWTSSSIITKMDENSNELENKDALGIYSSAVFESSHNMVIAVGGNAQYGQLAYDGFESYDAVVNGCPEFEYFGINSQLANPNISVTNNEAHTGKSCVKIESSHSLVYSFNVNTNAKLGGDDDMPFTIKQEDELSGFGTYVSNEDEKFLISYWIKEGTTEVKNDFSGINLSSNVLTISNSVTKSKIIEGWQKVDQIITIPSGSYLDVELEFENTSDANYYLDDLRLQPLQSSMKSFVYDFATMRFIAELDENNFATFYEYDEEGGLVRVKKETAKGIQTIQESRNHTSKSN